MPPQFHRDLDLLIWSGSGQSKSFHILSNTVIRLGGLTNHVYLLLGAVLQVPGQGTEEYINCSNEAALVKVTSQASVSPKVLYPELIYGLLVTRLIQASKCAKACPYNWEK